MGRMAKKLTDPGDAPGGQAGEDKEFFEDVLRGLAGRLRAMVERPTGRRVLVGALAAAASPQRTHEASPAESSTVRRPRR